MTLAKSFLHLERAFYTQAIVDIEEAATRLGWTESMDCLPWAYLCAKVDGFKAEVQRLRGALAELADLDCTYGDGCPERWGSHECCIGCKARRALAFDAMK